MSFVDGIIAMHITGPISGKPFPLGLIGASPNPVAVDTAILQCLNLDSAKSAIWRECVRRGFAGADPEKLDYPLARPSEFTADTFLVPEMLKPVSFNPLRILLSGCKRLAARLKESS